MERERGPWSSPAPSKLVEFMEVQDRQYDPEHWLAGNIDPVFTARRPNRWGYVLLVGAISATIGLIFYPDSSIWPEKIEIALFALLQYWVGFVLLRRRKT